MITSVKQYKPIARPCLLKVKVTTESHEFVPFNPCLLNISFILCRISLNPFLNIYAFLSRCKQRGTRSGNSIFTPFYAVANRGDHDQAAPYTRVSQSLQTEEAKISQLHIYASLSRYKQRRPRSGSCHRSCRIRVYSYCIMNVYALHIAPLHYNHKISHYVYKCRFT